MIIVDSDRLSILQHPESPQFERLTEALERSADSQLATTVVSLEEQMRGWFAAINRARRPHQQIRYYGGLRGIVDFYSRWHVLDFDALAADQFLALRKAGVRIATMGLMIAAIALVNDALLLSGNLRDFLKVPGLSVESWF